MALTGESSTLLALRDPDIRLMLRVRDDDNAAFAELVDSYRERLVNVLQHLVGSESEAEDLAQEVFLRAYLRLDSFRGDSRLSTWLYTITRNHCLNAVKKRGTEPVESGAAVNAEIAGSDGSEVHGAVELTESFQSLWRLMRDTLTPLEMRVVALHYGHEVPLAAITRSLVLSQDGSHLVVGGLLSRSLTSYKVEPFTGALTEDGSLTLSAGPERLSLDGQNAILAAGHANLLRWRTLAAEPGARAPSQVLRVSLAGGVPKEAGQVYGNDGSEIAGASVAVADGKRLLIGSSLDGRLLDCIQN